MGKILVLGAFGYSNNQLDGQTIKTRNVYNLLVERYIGKVMKADTQDIKTKPWLLFSLLYQLMTCKTLILLPCLNNLSYIFPVVYLLSKVFRYEIISICIGGWQVEYFQGNKRFKAHPRQLEYSKKIKAFLPEMAKVNNDLIKFFGFENSEVFPNFRKFELSEVHENNHDELRIVFMARINKTKGYESIFQALDKLKAATGKYTMTFYGQIADEDKSDFLNLLEQYKGIAEYKGALKPEEIHHTLSQYDVMLLPTKYYTEGFPGSILDAYIAGIPVIVTEWKHSHEFVDEGNTGFIIPFGDCVDDMVERIERLSKDRGLLLAMKQKAQKECLKYSEDQAWKVISKYL